MCRQIILVSKDSSQIISRISGGRLEKVHVTGAGRCDLEGGAISTVREALSASEEFIVPNILKTESEL
jgi:hypothetical protein